MKTVPWNGMLPVSGDVVIVEDDPVLRPLMVEILEGSGAKVQSFESADDALMHMLGSHDEYALLIADHTVPGQIQGLELVEMVRIKWPLIPLILTSGHPSDTIQPPEGVRFLQKPWDIDVLVNMVAQLIQPGAQVSRL